MNDLIIMALKVPAILIATTIHEFTRATVSTALGDTKPRNDGRLTLNPFKHFEPIGFILLLSTYFGWGKPVETRSTNYSDRKKGTLLVAILPNVANLIVAVIFTYLFKYFGGINRYLNNFLSFAIFYNIILILYNLVPVAPMDSVKVLSVTLPSNKYFKYIQYEKMIQMAFMFFLFFRTIPSFVMPIANWIINILNLIIL